jgi:hypothetical protein
MSMTTENGKDLVRPRGFDNRKSLVKLSVGFILVSVSLIFGYQYGMEVRPAGTGTISVSDAVQCIDQGADLYFNVTLGTDAYLKRLGEWENAEARLRTSKVFVLSANTHVGAITKLRLDDRVFLYAGGRQYPAVGKPMATTKHHNTYLAYFPSRGMDGEPLFEKEDGSFRIIIRDVGKLKSRIFEFYYPLPTARQGTDIDFAQVLMLMGAVIAALLIACTPCLVGTLALGSITIGSGWSERSQHSVPQVRAEMMRKTLYFLAAIVGGYLLIVVAIASLGVTVTDLRPVEVVGGLVLFALGASLLRNLKPFARLLDRVKRRMAHGSGSETADDGQSPVGAASSSAMGGSLAMLCSVAGAPTLATSIILPVMVYAGLTSLSWTFLIMALFLVVSAVPFLLIATGIGELVYSISARWRSKLLVANGLILMALGALMIFNGDNVANVISAPAELVLDAWKWVKS